MSDRPVAIVTGGARGIGGAISERLAADGYDVVINYVNSKAATETLIATIECGGGRALGLQANVADESACRSLVNRTLEEFGRVDVLVNNAGVATTGTLLGDTTHAQWREIIDTNLHGVFNMTHAVLPSMRAAKSGNIVNLSSNVTQRMPAGFGPYTVSKNAVEAFTRILGKEEGPNGIRVNAIAPGPIMTDMFQELMEVMGPERAEAFVKSVPLGRTGQPAEIAAMVAMLVSETASFVTSEVIYVNGGGPGG